ncbi:MAG: FAD binding domain-containing protein, partial [Ferrovibrio sp.]
AREVGSPQIQNAGTVAGNICNASPAADGTAALMALGALVEVSGPQGTRQVALGDFVTGVRRVDLAADELVTAVLVPDHGPRAVSRFLKLGARKYLVISIAMVSVVLEVENNVISAASVAVGACSAVAQRLPYLEAELIGRRLNSALANRVEPAQFEALQPIDDIRATAAYRREAAIVLVRRALTQLGKKGA